MMDYNISRKLQLDTRELLLLDAEVKRKGKNMAIAYILWYFLGILGAHQFYTGRTAIGVIQLVLSLTVLGLFVTVVWWIVDAFLLYNWVNQRNVAVESEVLDYLFYNRGSSGIKW
ncbi:MAG: hypothetical protein K0S39_1977 [Paenibacillus sp.]|nr:hypothetical protein [Paenibacillus sp.]